MTPTQWPPGPAAPSLASGTVDVWCADLAAASAGGCAPMPLSDDEREHAARFVQPGGGERWAAARGILRTLLGAYADADPRELRFAEGPHGKPRLAGAHAGRGRGLRFNVSHSGDVALYAFALEREVGVDVELPRRAVDHVAIARRVLGDADAGRLEALAPPQREREFLRVWVRWEAVLKCRGTGIGGAEGPFEGPEPWVCDLDVGAPAAAALAVEDGPCSIRCRAWPAAAA